MNADYHFENYISPENGERWRIYNQCAFEAYKFEREYAENIELRYQVKKLKYVGFWICICCGLLCVYTRYSSHA